ncbi:hypothetical protein MVEN_02472400 [Mycena venus]|uniref:Nucleoporin Nup159/Nup146 N-terminal domain-containing protein n=1 Tax=Mycena venus TaxID=2733690 RepID=A0A8H7CAV8_9AGAR|nr:hypothetical protein MVEN_02472400 [Mycena venus]
MSFAPLTRPAQSQVNLDHTQNRPQADGFNWPTFRLLNKQSRVTLSPDFLAPSNVRKVFTTANLNGGLFAATTSKGLIISPLSDLRDAFKTGTDTVFTPKRTLACNPVSIAFACNDTRLLAGTETGQILVFDIAQLSSSAAQVDPIQVFQGSSSPAAQILPNPSNENELAQLVAIVRVDGTVQMFNMQMESKGAWAGTDFESTPVAASWSPKGKQLAIGLRSGDILTFALTNNNTPLKHIPPTANSHLVSLHWVGPAFTFRTSYSANPVDPSPPYRFFGPPIQHSGFLLVLPRWDQDSTTASPEESKTLVVVGDTSSTDLEVLGNTGSRWFQQSQENQLTVPLDKNDEDTFLLTLDVDLTDELPIMYAYLNDGTIQGWHVTHPDSKQYAGLGGAAQASPSAPAFGQQQPSTTFGQQSPSPFAQPSPTTAFGKSSGFGQSSTTSFGQPQSTPAFGQSGFGQPSMFGQSSFGQSSTSTSSAFGSTNNAFSAFASNNNAFSSSAGSGFGAQGNTPPSAPPLNSTPSVSMGEATPSFGGLSLGSSNSESETKNKAVGGGMFGSPAPLPLPPNHPANQPTIPAPSNFSDPALIKPASGFGAFGAVTSGAFGNPKPPGTSAFGGGGAFSGGAFGGGSSSAGTGSNDAKPTTPSTTAPAFGKSTFGQTGFGQTGFGFGQTGFGQKPASAFGQSGFGSSGAAPTTPSGGGGFSAFASSGPTGFANAAASSTSGSGGNTSSPSGAPAAPAAGAFGAFSAQGPSAFGKPATGSVFSGGNGANAFGGGGASPSPSSASALGGGGTLPGRRRRLRSVLLVVEEVRRAPPAASGFGGFGTPTHSLFGNKTPQPNPAAQPDSTSSSPDPAKDRKSPSPGDSPPPSAPSQLKFTTTSTPTTTGAFGNLKSAPSGFKPASGFGAFGSDTTPTSSPFFNTASQAPKAPAVSAFGNLSSTPPTTPKPAAGGSPAFGSPSQLGGFKSAFASVSPAATPPKTPTMASGGGFSAFSSSPVSLTSSSTPAKSFGDLLKAGDRSQDKPKPATVFSGSGLSGTLPKPEVSSPSSSPAPVVPIKPVPVFTPPPKDTETTARDSEPKSKDKAAESSSPKDGKGTSESSFGGLSQSSSFVEVSGGDVEDDADGEAEEAGGEEDGDDDDDGSFLSESFGSGSEAPPDDDDGEDDSRSPSPSAVPLPPSRSPSSTPRSEAPPKVQVSESPTPSEDEESDDSEGRLSTIREESTTPPGSPEKNSSPPAKTPLAAPVPVAPSPFGLGLGRPSSRPTRSSPLANAPVSNDEDEETVKDEKPILKPRPASPKPIFGALPPQLKTESIEEKAEPAAKPPRPKTPPLSALSFGSSTPKAPLNATKIPLAGASLPAFPVPPKASPVTPASPSPTPAGGVFGFGTPKSMSSPTVSTPVPAPKGFFWHPTHRIIF